MRARLEARLPSRTGKGSRKYRSLRASSFALSLFISSNTLKKSPDDSADAVTNRRVENLHGRIILPRTNVDERSVSNFLRQRPPIGPPNILLLAAVFEQNGFAIGVKFTTTSHNLALYVHGQLYVFREFFEHLIQLLLRCA